MKKVKVVAGANLPNYFPFQATAVLWLLMDRSHVTGAWAGMIWTLWGIISLVMIIRVFIVERVDIFKDK